MEEAVLLEPSAHFYERGEFELGAFDVSLRHVVPEVYGGGDGGGVGGV